MIRVLGLLLLALLCCAGISSPAQGTNDKQSASHNAAEVQKEPTGTDYSYPNFQSHKAKPTGFR
jgi:hypothetical protein